LALSLLTTISGRLPAADAPPAERVFGLYCTIKESREANLDFIKKCRASGINMLYPSLCGGGVYWKTSLENNAADYKKLLDGGFDPLADFLKVAHENNIKVIPSIAIGPIGLAASQHPEWITRDRHGNLSGDTTATSMTFAYPEARAAKVAVIMDLVNQYPVDGIILDYCRYPENTKTQESSYGFYGYDEPFIEICQKLYSFDPRTEPINSPKWNLFNQLRKDSVTAFVAEFRSALKKAGKNLTLIAFGDTDPAMEAAACARDYGYWARTGLIDGFLAGTYMDTPETIGKTIVRMRAAIGPKAQLYTSLTPFADRVTTEPQMLEMAKVQLEGDVNGLWIYRDDFFIKHDLWGAALKTRKLINESASSSQPLAQQ
jgi:uncharacterized lipoprotein YddW (UPF0748 family)